MLSERTGKTPEEVRSILLNSLAVGSWESYGSGEIGAVVRTDIDAEKSQASSAKFEDYMGSVVLELKGDNGSNHFYNPTGKPWGESLDDKNVQDRAVKKLLDNFSEEELVSYILEVSQITG